MNQTTRYKQEYMRVLVCICGQADSHQIYTQGVNIIVIDAVRQSKNIY